MEPLPAHPAPPEDLAFILTPSERLAIEDARLIFFLARNKPDEAHSLTAPADPDDPNDYDLPADTLATLDKLCDRLEHADRLHGRDVRRWIREMKAWEERNGPLRR